MALSVVPNGTWSTFLWLVALVATVYYSVLAAVSYVIYCYHWIRGKYPWFQEETIRKYGDVVRVGPNEIVFFTPQAAMDIYGPAVKSQELFVKTDLMDFAAGDLGFIWESDPVKRKAVARKILPAFSSKAIREKEPIVESYIDFFISRMKELGGGKDGLLMNDWLLWLGVDMGADLAYSRKLRHMETAQTSDFVETLRGTSFVGTLVQLSKKMPIIAVVAPLFVPFRILRAIPTVFKANAAEVKARIDSRGKTEHPDFMDYMIGPKDPPPQTKQELTHIEQVAFQMFVAVFDPVQITFYAVLFFLLKYPRTLKILQEEIRDSYNSYDQITQESLTELPYLRAFIHETLRMHLTTPTGMPRISPGAMVDGVYVPKGVVVQLSSFTAMRHERYFRDPSEFRPERWLPAEHPLYDTRYADDNLKAFFPFSLGPRQCTGREIAWSQTRLFLGKVLWTFDLEGVRGHEKSYDKDFSVHVMWNRPQLYVRFNPVGEKFRANSQVA